MRAKLKAIRPETIGAASQIAGVTPAALMILLAHLRNQSRNAA
jgi:tRNA U34 5-carboxymethylaminomethyl modifying enzyme MnmG/GidA